MLPGWVSDCGGCDVCGGCGIPHRHGDLLYLSEKADSGAGGLPVAPQVREDEVDQILAAKDGTIQRPRDPQLYVWYLLLDLASYQLLSP